MRFDDSLKTVLAADASTAFGAQATFRQLADLIARGRVVAGAEPLGRLRQLREQVPADVRAAVARSFALAQPPVALVAFFAEDEPGVASAVLRGVRLPAAEWIALIPQLGPSGRAALRRREDLTPDVLRALESFGSTDFALAYAPDREGKELEAEEPQAEGGDTFRRAPDQASETPSTAGDATELLFQEPAPAPLDRAPSVAAGFDIAELVDRIASYQEQRAAAPAAAMPAEADHFRFHLDAAGVIRWTDAVPRGALIGADLFGADLTCDATKVAGADAAAREAFCQRTSFTDAWLTLDATGPLGGAWRISAVPLFDPVTGHFIGHQGAARRPRVDQIATELAEKGNAEGLRRLVHELRTPTNAIAGFSELIETQLLGPVAPPYRERAAAIRLLAADLVTTIEDLDLAARIEGQALELRPETVALRPTLERVLADLQPLAAARGATLALAPVEDTLRLSCDARAAERLMNRLIATLVSAGQDGEVIRVAATSEGKYAVVTVTCPRALADMPEDQLLSMDAASDSQAPGAPLLGTGFALRLARNLAAQLGGSLTITSDLVTVVLPSAAADAFAISGQAGSP